MLALLLCALAAPAPAAAAECWTGQGCWVDPAARGYKGQRLLMATRGPAEWRAGVPVTLCRLDAIAGGFDQDLAPLVITPGVPTFSRCEPLSYVTALASVAGPSNLLTFRVSHIVQTSFGLERLTRFYRWACGLSRERG